MLFSSSLLLPRFSPLLFSCSACASVQQASVCVHACVCVCARLCQKNICCFCKHRFTFIFHLPTISKYYKYIPSPGTSTIKTRHSHTHTSSHTRSTDCMELIICIHNFWFYSVFSVCSCCITAVAVVCHFICSYCGRRTPFMPSRPLCHTLSRSPRPK